MIDLGFEGYPFTWCNKRTGIECIEQRLDRAVGNSSWITLFPMASVLHLTPIASDHSPILLTTAPESIPRTPFKFENMWFEDNICYDTVDRSWKKPVTGSPPFRLHSKIKNVKADLKEWNTNQFGNCPFKAKEVKDKIAALQYQDKTDINKDLEKNLMMELDTWLNRVDIFWRQKSKDKWLKDGDANTSVRR
ncbi:hypothetical protein CASFOL_000841 [Castilleja foliolosa]|uniref:Uncharacterized protein n=1 Tax=Castilleja foliolosa TaxID=1961234 RepID=A0ABD3ELD2_9LAMI